MFRALTPFTLAIEREKQPTLPPVRIRFREFQEPVVTWKEAFIKLLKQFDATQPGLLFRIASEQSLQAVIATDGDRYRRSKMQIDGVWINTHASAAQLQDWCRKIARIGNIAVEDFEFILDQGNVGSSDNGQ